MIAIEINREGLRRYSLVLWENKKYEALLIIRAFMHLQLVMSQDANKLC